MTISATLPVDQVDAANAALAKLGHGPSNFSVPLRTGTDAATHAGLHSWDDAGFLAALQSLGIPGLVIRDEPGQVVNFEAHVSEQALEWSDPSEWFLDPVMTGDIRTGEGKTWESLVDYNVWPFPIGWREVVEDGYPAWVQPTSAVDAYSIDEMATHDNPNDNGNLWVYRSKIDANTTEPGRDGTFDRWWEPVEPA